MMQWLGSLLGLLGAFLLATNSRLSRWGWIAFLGANLAMISFAWQIQAHGLLLQQLGFTATSCLGWCRSGLEPVRKYRNRQLREQVDG